MRAHTVHGVADRLLFVVVVGERHRSVAVPDRDRAAVLDLLQRSFLGRGRGGKCEHREQSDSTFHKTSSKIVDCCFNAKILLSVDT